MMDDTPGDRWAAGGGDEPPGRLIMQIGRAVERTARGIAHEVLDEHERQSHDMRDRMSGQALIDVLAGLIDEHERRHHGGHASG